MEVNKQSPQNTQAQTKQPTLSVSRTDGVPTPSASKSGLANDFSHAGAQTFGARLKWAREQKNCTLEQAADELHILKRHLQALEEEDFEALPQMTFARGFTINYAKYLNLDPNMVVKNFEEVYPAHLRGGNSSEIKTPLQPLGTLQRDARRPNFRINPLLLLGLIGLIVLAVFLLRTVNNARQQTAETPESEVAINNISSTEQAQGAALTNTTATNTGSALTLDNAGSAIGAAVSGSVLAEDNLDLWVRDNTNITVTDAKGTVLLTGEQSRGGYKVTGQPPFQIQIDKVDNVTLNLNQQKVALSGYAQNNQANFSLAP